MCGVAGVLGIGRDVAEPALNRMLGALRHRGPDGQATEFFSTRSGTHAAGLAHARLAIIDTSAAGRQPMTDAVGNAIVTNGEIYNYRALQAELAAAGQPCRTQTDTEVILGAYRVWGIDAVERMRGMFAWCLLDSERGTAWFCRDRLGIKPLYFVRPAQGGLLFASEVRALLAAGPELVPPEISPSALESFLAQGMVTGQDAIIKGVRMLAPGESLVTDWDGNEQRRQKYWQLPFERGTEQASDRPARAGAVGELSAVLREAVDLHLIADVPLGLFLSSGVDSSALTAIATEVSSARIHTVSVGFDDPKFDESAGAAEIAIALGTEHQTVRVMGGEMVSDISEVFAAMDQPTVDGFNSYFVSRAARRAGLTVALSGVGGDELFGGYASFRDVPRGLKLARFARRIPGGGGRFAKAMRLFGRRSGVKLEELFRRSPEALGIYLLRRELFLPAERRALHRLPVASDPESGLPLAHLRELRAQLTGLDPENTISACEVTSYMRDMLLRDGDVFSMAVGLELRVPLIDHRFVEVASRLPGKWKRRDPRPKPLLIDAVGPRLPASTYRNRKRGFTFPWDGWLRGPLKEAAARALGNGDAWTALGMDPDEPSSMWRRFQERDPRVGALQIVAMWVLVEFVTRHGLRVAS
jgi:asparagine synthase (glutamine-hydrolysing)